MHYLRTICPYLKAIMILVPMLICVGCKQPIGDVLADGFRVGAESIADSLLENLFEKLFGNIS